jgi:cell fate regulator YaaT (PSP1 superfamily)
MVEDNEIVSPLKPLIRIATEDDLRLAAQTKAKEKDAFIICNECIEKHKIDMHLVDAEYTFDGSKLMFYFTSDGRVDFRELLKELARIFRTRIDLRQIGVRDEAKMLGGIGICGRPFCCSSFLNEFQPVSIKMAKEQSLSLNPMKISGACGRLMCCLKYEQAAYEDLAKRVPPVGSLVETPDGKGIVTEATLLKERIKVRLDRAPDQAPAEYQAGDCKILRKSHGGYDKTENIPE